MKYGKAILTVIGVAALLVSFTSQASAEIIGFPALNIRFNDHGHGPPIDLSPRGIFNNEHRKFNYGNGGNPHIIRTPLGEDSWLIEWEIQADPDPFLHVVYNITNAANFTDDFDVTFTLDINPPIFGDSLTGGSVSLTVIDSDGSGDTAELSSHSSGAPIYMAQIDGIDFLPSALLTPSQSFITDPYGTTASGLVPEEFGSPIPSLPGPPVDSEIGIVLSGRLTAGDTAVIVATFVVTPEPGTIALLTLGGMTMLMRRRRHRA
jgi:hypothetical protein